MDIQDNIIKNRNKDYSFKLIVVGVILFIGIVTLKQIFGYLLILLGVFVIFYSSGTEFDLNNRTVRGFNSLFGIKVGNWKELNKYYSISVKRTRKGYRIYSRASTSSIDSLDTHFEVFLMGKKHVDSILLFDSESKKESIGFATLWSSKLDIPIKPFGYK